MEVQNVNWSLNKTLKKKLKKLYLIHSYSTFLVKLKAFLVYEFCLFSGFYEPLIMYFNAYSLVHYKYSWKNALSIIMCGKDLKKKKKKCFALCKH